MSATSCDVTKIQDEDTLRKMWQDTEDFGKKKEIRAHMYKLREARLRDFYSNEATEKDIRRSHSSSNMREQRKVTENTHHADSLLDHSFLSLKSKEIRDSESPTRDITYKIKDKLSTDKGWTIRESKERSQDGKTHTINRLATTSGSEAIDKGVANYAAKNEQHSSVYQDGDEKNFVKAVGASNRSVIQQEAKGGDENSQFYTTSTTTKSSSKFVSEQKSSSDDFEPATRTTTGRSTPDDFNKQTRRNNYGQETVTRKTYDYNIPEEFKKSPNYVEGKTKVYTETKTLPDGSTVTSTRYETIGGCSSYSTTKKQVNTQQEQKQQQNVSSRQTVVRRTTDGGTVRSEEFVIQPNIEVRYIEGKRNDVYDQKNVINRHEKHVVDRTNRDEKHVVDRQDYRTNRDEKHVVDRTTRDEKHVVNKQDYRTNRDEKNVVERQDREIIRDVKVVKNQTEQRGSHDDQNQTVRTVTRRTEQYETIPDDQTRRPTNREEIVITRSSPTETIVTKKGPTQTVVTKTTTVRTVGGKVDDKTIAEDFINTEKQQRVRESGDVRTTVTKVVRKTENDIQPVIIEITPRDDKTITKVTKTHVVSSKTYDDGAPKPREASPTKTPQEQVCRPAKTPKDEPKYEQPERRQPIKQKQELDAKTHPTEGQYQTTYRTDFINKKISVEVSPTHDAFARSLRSVTPERDRKSVSPSLRTSTSSLRSSISPEKRYPRRDSPDGTPRRGNRYSPDRRDGSPRKTMPDRSRYTPDDSPRRTRPSPSYRGESPRKTPSDRDVSPRKVRPSPNYREESPRKTPQYRDDSPRKAPLYRDDSPRKTPQNRDDTPRKTPQYRDDSPRKTPQRDDSPRKMKPESPRQTPDRYTTRKPSQETLTKTTVETYNTDTITRRKQTDQIDSSTLTRRPKTQPITRSRSSSPTDTVSDFEYHPKGQITDLDEVPRKENLTTTTVTKRTKKVTERSPTSPIKQTPVKEAPRRSSLRATRHPDMESPTDFKPFTPKQEKVLRRTDTYEERCRLILGITEPENPRKPSLPDTGARNSKSPEKKSPTQRRPSEEQPRRQTPRQESPTKSTRPSVQEFPAQVRKSPEKRPREESPTKAKPKKTQDAPQMQEFPSQIRKSPERRPQEEAPVKEKPRDKEAPQTQEFPAQIRKSPERNTKEDSPLREQPRKTKEDSPLREIPRRPKEDSPHREQPRRPKEDSPLREIPRGTKDDSPLREQPRRTKEDSPLREQPRRPSDAPQLQEFPAQTRKIPQRIPKEDSPIKEKPRKPEDAPQLQEFPSQTRRTPETKPSNVRPSFDTSTPVKKRKSPKKKTPKDDNDSTTEEEYEEDVTTSTTEICKTRDVKQKPTERKPKGYEITETVTTEYVIIDGKKVRRDSIPRNMRPDFEITETTTTEEYVIIGGKKVPKKPLTDQHDVTQTRTTEEYIIIDGRRQPKESKPVERQPGDKQPQRPGYNITETVTTEEYTTTTDRKGQPKKAPTPVDHPKNTEVITTEEYVTIDNRRQPKKPTTKPDDNQPKRRNEITETVTTQECVVLQDSKIPKKRQPEEITETTTEEYIIVNGKRQPKPKDCDVTETVTTEEYIIVDGKRQPKSPKKKQPAGYQLTDTVTTEEYVMIDGKRQPKSPKKTQPEGYEVTETVTTEEYVTVNGKRQPKSPKKKQPDGYEVTETVTEYVTIDGKRQPKQPTKKQPEGYEVTETVTTEEYLTIDGKRQPKSPKKQPEGYQVTETVTTEEYVTIDGKRQPKSPKKQPDGYQVTETVTTEEYVTIDGKRQPKSPKKKQPEGYDVTETVTTEEYIIVDGKRQPKRKPQTETNVTEEFVIIDGKKVFNKPKHSEVKVVITTTKDTTPETDDKPRKSPEKQVKKPKDSKPGSFDVSEVVTTTTTTTTSKQKPKEETPKPKSVKERVDDINVCRVTPKTLTDATTEFITRVIEDETITTKTQPKSKPLQPKKERKIPTSDEINVNQEFIRRIIEDDTIESYTQEIEEQERLKQSGKPKPKQPADKKQPTRDEPDEPKKSFVDSILSKITKEEYDVVNKYSKILNEDEDKPEKDDVIERKKVQPTTEARVKPVLTKQMTEEEKIAHAIRYSQGERVPVEEPMLMKRLSYDVYDDSDDEPSKRRESPKRPSPIKRQPEEDERVTNFLINEQIEFEVKRSPERLSPVKAIPEVSKSVKKDLSRLPKPEQHECKKTKAPVHKLQGVEDSPKIKHKVVAKVDLQKPKDATRPKEARPDAGRPKGMVEIRLKGVPRDGLPKSKPKGVTRDDSPKSRPKTVDESPKSRPKPVTRDDSPKPRQKQAVVEVKPKLKPKSVVDVKARPTSRDESPKPRTPKTVDVKKTKVTTCVVNIKEVKPKITTTVVKTVRNGVLKEPSRLTRPKPEVIVVDAKPTRETKKRTTISTTINLKSKPGEKPRSKAKPVQNGHSYSDDEDHEVPQRKKCVSTKSIIINETVADEREIIVNLQRSKSSREETPDRVWPVTTDEDTGIPRYPDQISEPDEPRRVLKKVNDVPLLEDEDVTEFSRITELIDAKITEVDRVQETDECLLTVNEKVNKFSSRPKGKPKNLGPAPKVERPRLDVDEELEEDDCLLSVSDKVSKFITTAEKLSVSEVPDRPKSPRCQNIPADCLTEKVNKFIESAELLTKRERSPPKKNSVDILPVITRSTVEEFSTIVTEEDMYRVPEDNKPSKPNTRASPEKVFRIPQEEYSPRKSPRASPEKETRASPEKVVETTPRRQSPEKITKRAESPKPAPDSPRKNVYTTPKDSKAIPNNRTQSRHLVDENTTPKSSKRADDTPVGRLRSTESIKKARALFENYDKERPKQIDILSRPSVFEGRKIKHETELKSTKVIESIRRSQSPGEVPHYMTQIERTVRQGSPLKETPRKGESPVRESTPHSADEDVPHYMTHLDRTVRQRSPQKESPNELRPESPQQLKTPVNENVPHYMTQLDRSLRQKSPHIESVRELEEIAKGHVPHPDEGKPNKFGVVLRRTESGRLEKRRTSTTITLEIDGVKTDVDIEEIHDLDVLENLLEKIVGYDLRRRIRAQIRVVKKLIEDQRIETVTTKRVYKLVSPAKSSRETPERKRPTPDRKTETSETRSTYSYSEQRRRSSDVKLVTRTRSPETKTITKTTTTTEVVRSKSPETKHGKTPRGKSPETKVSTPRSKSPEGKRKSVSEKKTGDDKPEWVTQRNLKKVTERNVVVAKKTPVKEDAPVKRKSPEKETNVITSSYGVGPTDENGSPLFGLRALRAQNKNEHTKVQGMVTHSTFYSENGSEPVGEVSITKYSTDPRDLGNVEDAEHDKEGILSKTTVQKFGYKDTPSYKTLTDKKKPNEKTDESRTSSTTTTTTKVTRRGSVKEMSQKFIDNAVETLKSEKQSSYPKAGLILRTSSFKDGSGGSSREGSPTGETEEIRKTVKVRTTGSKGETFLTNTSKISGVQDVITRMKTEECVEGDTEEDAEARTLLNKFLGSQVLLSGMEKEMRKSSASAATTSTTSGSSTKRITKVTSTITENGVPRTTTTSYTHPITSDVLENIWDEQTLRLLLDQSTEYEERRVVRARLKQVMAEKEVCSEFVEKTIEENQTGNTQEKVETTRKTISDGPFTKTQVTTTTRTSTQHVKKPLSPFAKFRQLDKQNSLPTPPSTPKTPTSGGPLFKFTDPNLTQSASTIKERLLQWCKMKTKEYENINLENFSTSWADGLAFCALIHHFLPDAFDYYKLTPNNRRYNFVLSFQVAYEKADIYPLLDVDDMVATRKPDWKCVFTYVQSIYRRFKDED